MTVPSITDDLIAEIEEAAKECGPMSLDTAEAITASQEGKMIECPVCCGEGYASAENDYCNFDNHAIGVEFYGIGPHFGAAERYFRAASPSTILDLITRLRDSERDAERYKWMRRHHVGASFDWDDDGMCVLAIQVPDDLAITRDLDKTIDAAITRERTE